MAPSYITLLQIVLPVFLIIGIGFFVRKAKWLNQEADESLLKLSVNLLYPCLIVDSILGNPSLREIKNITLPPLLGFFTIALGYAIAMLGTRLLKLSGDREKRTFTFTVGIYNYGYVPIPLVIALFDKATTGILFTFNLGVEIAFWTAGIMILTGSSQGNGWKKVLNAPVLAIVGSVILNFLNAHLWLPKAALTTFHMLGQSSIPLALLLTGATLADLLAGKQFRESYPIASMSCLLRLGVLPLLFLFIAKIIPAAPELKRVLIVQAAMPCALFPIVIAKHYGGNPNTALQIVISTSIMGLLTIPFWIQVGLKFIAP